MNPAISHARSEVTDCTVKCHIPRMATRVDKIWAYYNGANTANIQICLIPKKREFFGFPSSQRPDF